MAEKEEVKESKKEEPSIEKLWNRFIQCFALTQQAWEAFEEKTHAMRSVEIDQLPVQVQKVMAMIPRGNFDLMVPNFVRVYRGMGGLEALKTEEKGE